MCFSVVVLGFKKVPVDLFSYWLLSVLHFHMLSCLPGTAVMVCSSGCVISLVCLFLHKDFTRFYRHILILMPGDSQNYIHLRSQKHMTVAASYIQTLQLLAVISKQLNVDLWCNQLLCTVDLYGLIYDEDRLSCRKKKKKTSFCTAHNGGRVLIMAEKKNVCAAKCPLTKQRPCQSGADAVDPEPL